MKTRKKNKPAKNKLPLPEELEAASNEFLAEQGRKSIDYDEAKYTSDMLKMVDNTTYAVFNGGGMRLLWKQDRETYLSLIDSKH